MQRRAAAAYVALFLVVGAVSFSLIATATPPSFSLENPEHSLEVNESFTADGTEYTVASIDAEGGAQAVERSGVIRWTNESAVYTDEWANESTVSYDGESWNVSVEPGDNTTEFTLVEAIDRTAILRNDSGVANRTTTVDGEEYVVREENGSRTLVPADEYFPEPRTQQFAQGDRFDYGGNETTVASVSADAATLRWTAPRENEVNVANDANVTLGGTTYFAHFPDNSTMELTRDFEQYQAHQEATTEFDTQTNGLWGVTILSGLSVVFLGALAYLPSRY